MSSTIHTTNLTTIPSTRHTILRRGAAVVIGAGMALALVGPLAGAASAAPSLSPKGIDDIIVNPKPPVTVPPVIVNPKPPVTVPPVTVPPVIVNPKPPVTVPPVIVNPKPPVTVPPVTIPPVIVNPEPPVTVPPAAPDATTIPAPTTVPVEVEAATEVRGPEAARLAVTGNNSMLPIAGLSLLGAGALIAGGVAYDKRRRAQA